MKIPPLTALLAGIAALSALLVVPLPLGRSAAGTIAVHDALHLPFFALLLALIYAVLRRIRSIGRGRALLRAILLTTLLGAASEWAQTFSSRTASWEDLRFNLLGIAAGASTITGTWLKGSRFFVGGVVLLAALWGAAALRVARPALKALAAADHQAGAFPLLGDFENDWESFVWIPQGDGGDHATRISFSSAHPTRGRHSLMIESAGSAWAGVRVLIEKPLPWLASQSLQFDLFNPGDGFSLGVRVDGSGGERFTAEVHVGPGRNQCALPLAELASRDLKLAQRRSFTVRAIVFHLGELPASRRFYLDNVRLE